MENVFNDGAILKFHEHTGDFMFQFDDDEPYMISSIHNYGKVSIELQQKEQPKKSEYNELTAVGSGLQTNCITFVSKEGKTFKLFIKDKI